MRDLDVCFRFMKGMIAEAMADGRPNTFFHCGSAVAGAPDDCFFGHDRIDKAWLVETLTAWEANGNDLKGYTPRQLASVTWSYLRTKRLFLGVDD